MRWKHTDFQRRINGYEYGAIQYEEFYSRIGDHRTQNSPQGIKVIRQNLRISRGSWKSVLRSEESKMRITPIIHISKCYRWNEGQLLSASHPLLLPIPSPVTSRRQAESCRNAGAGPFLCCCLWDNEKDWISHEGEAAWLCCQNCSNKQVEISTKRFMLRSMKSKSHTHQTFWNYFLKNHLLK